MAVTLSRAVCIKVLYPIFESETDARALPAIVHFQRFGYHFVTNREVSPGRNPTRFPTRSMMETTGSRGRSIVDRNTLPTGIPHPFSPSNTRMPNRDRRRKYRTPYRALKGMQARTIRLSNALSMSLIHISEPTRLGMISYAVFCL